MYICTIGFFDGTNGQSRTGGRTGDWKHQGCYAGVKGDIGTTGQKGRPPAHSKTIRYVVDACPRSEVR